VELDEVVINWIKSIEVDAQVAVDAWGPYDDSRGGGRGLVLSGSTHA